VREGKRERGMDGGMDRGMDGEMDGGMDGGMDRSTEGGRRDRDRGREEEAQLLRKGVNPKERSDTVLAWHS